jgi:hypothetical protein
MTSNDEIVGMRLQRREGRTKLGSAGLGNLEGWDSGRARERERQKTGPVSGRNHILEACEEHLL